VVQWLRGANTKQSVNKHLVEKYGNILQRVVAIVKFLAEQELALCGDD
jgi:methionyl-tRNA synthetase